MSWTTTRIAAGHDVMATNVTHVIWSENGSSESANVAGTAVTLKSATNADPSVVSNDGALESAAASSGCTITHWGFAATSTLQTTWNEFDDPVVLLAGGKITVADGALKENIDQTTSAPA